MKTLALLLMMAGLAAAAPGLDTPQPVGAFLNGVFPTTTPGPTGSWGVADAFPNLTFIDPVRMMKDPLSAEHVYIVCRNGEIWHIPFSASATSAQKVRVLDRRANTWGFEDSGMLSLSFHPEFGVPGSPNRGYVYVFYQYVPQQPGYSYSGAPSYMRLSRFTVPDGQVVFDPASELVMIQQFDRHNWHSGGQSFFGPEGFLYVVLGDEGGSNDEFNVCQKINDRLFSGILRLDVDRNPERSHPIRKQPNQIAMPSGWEPSYTQGYYVPNDNPWQDPTGADGILEEFWSIGTRSPYSMHFDDETGDIWIAEVGQNNREEITLARKGGNHQWPYMEGFATGAWGKPATIIGEEVPPIFDYARWIGGCIIGGMVYRGNAHQGALGGKFIFGDHTTRALYFLNHEDGQPATAQYLASVNRYGGNKSGLSGICEGPDGEPYFMELGNMGTDTGKILKLTRNGTPIADPPQLLSQTGAFTNLANLTPAAGLMPYDVNSPLWSDGTEKFRWIAIPNDGTHDTAAEQVTYRETGAWDFPIGTVLVKHFALPIDERDPSIVKPVETRFFIHGADGVYYGVTYRWNEAGTDAQLLTDRDSRDFTITDLQGTTRVQRWDFPSRSDCRTCHSMIADNVLGPRSHQLNGNTFYPATGRSANQLETWNQLGIFGSSFGARNPAALPRSVNPHDPHASLDSRVRSYIDANCSHCHNPNGVSANFDALFNTPLAAQGLVDGVINRPFSSSDERVVKAGDPLLSLMHVRASRVGGGQMPPLAKNVVDVKGVALIEDWIRSLDQASFDFVSPNVPPVAGDDTHVATHQSASAVNVITNDSDANAPPGIHGITIVSPPLHGSIRISGAEKRIIYTHDGSSARSDSFTYTLTDPQGASSAPATVQLSIPFDFAAWSAQTAGATGTPASNNDGDLSADLLEFALGGLPNSGATPEAASVSIDASGSDVSITVRRPVGLSGVSYAIETSPDLGIWSDAGAPALVSESGGVETLRLSSLQTRPGLSADAGFARLKVRLDNTPNSSVTLPLGWRAVDFAGSKTFGSPFRSTPLFSSTVTASEGLRIGVNGSPQVPSGFKGFIEVIAGSFAGHRFEVESVSSDSIVLAAAGPHTMIVPDLTGCRVVLCAHQTLGGLFNKDLFKGSTNPAAADQVQIYQNDGVSAARFDLYYLLDARPNNPTHQWRAFLPGAGNQDGRVIPPGQGVFVKRPAGALAVKAIHTGQVRANPFVHPLFAGVNLAASPFPLPLSPRQSGLLDPSSGFVASTNLNAADQFHLHQSGAFRIFYLLDHPSLPDFWREAVASSPNSNDAPLFAPTEAVFLKRSAAAPSHRVPVPWNP